MGPPLFQPLSPQIANLARVGLTLDQFLLLGRGTVNREEMMEFGRFINSKFDEEKLNKLMDLMDLDKDGLISFEEFLAYFAKVCHSCHPVGPL